MILDYVDRESIKKNRNEADSLYTTMESLKKIGKKLTPPEQQEFIRIRDEFSVRKMGGASIDINMILSERRSDYSPRWTIASPYYEISSSNGSVEAGYFRGNPSWRFWLKRPSRKWFPRQGSDSFSSVDISLKPTDENHQFSSRPGTVFIPIGGYPLLPNRIREIIESSEIKKAYDVGLIYQPKQWAVFESIPADPDPALIVRWNKESEWKCIAVWGHDGPHIEEFLF